MVLWDFSIDFPFLRIIRGVWWVEVRKGISKFPFLVLYLIFELLFSYLLNNISCNSLLHPSWELLIFPQDNPGKSFRNIEFQGLFIGSFCTFEVSSILLKEKGKIKVNLRVSNSNLVFNHISNDCICIFHIQCIFKPTLYISFIWLKLLLKKWILS